MRMSSKHSLIIFFLLIIFAEGVVQSVVEIRDNERPFIVDLFTKIPNRTNLRNFEDELEERSVISDFCQPRVRYFQYVALGDAGDKALLGKDDWFFYRQGVQYLIEPWPARNDSNTDLDYIVDAMVDFRDQLNARGIELLVVPMPGKSSIYPEMLAGRAEDRRNQVSEKTRRLMSQMQAAGIELVDLFALYYQESSRGDALYLKQDTHWSTHGMHLAAKQVAERILERGWITQGSTDYELKPISFARYGDVLRMMNLPKVQQRYEPETLRCTQVIDLGSGQPYVNDPDSEVLVLGDSFLRIYEKDEPGSAGFISHLACELKTPISSIIQDGGASTLIRQELARKPELLLNKKVVVWEFVERDIRFGMEGWQKTTLRDLP